MGKVEEWLKEDIKRFYGFCNFHSDNFSKLLIKNYNHSDRWSMVYDWLHENFKNDLYKGIETDLTEYWEIHDLHMK